MTETLSESLGNGLMIGQLVLHFQTLFEIYYFDLAPPSGERVVLGEWQRGIVGLVVCTGKITMMT